MTGVLKHCPYCEDNVGWIYAEDRQGWIRCTVCNDGPHPYNPPVTHTVENGRVVFPVDPDAAERGLRWIAALREQYPQLRHPSTRTATAPKLPKRD